METSCCSICLQAITDTNKCTLSCNHTFHADCIINSVIHKNKCPLCRITIDLPSFKDYSKLKNQLTIITNNFCNLHECYDLLLELKSGYLCRNCRHPPSETRLI